MTSTSTKKKTRILFTTGENEILMVQAIQEHTFPGVMWPNRERPRFDLELTDEEYLLLKLKVPCDTSE